MTREEAAALGAEGARTLDATLIRRSVTHMNLGAKAIISANEQMQGKSTEVRALRPARSEAGPLAQPLALVQLPPVLPAAPLTTVSLHPDPVVVEFRQDMTAEEDIASVASQLATLTHTVEEMAGELKEVREQAESDRERTDAQQERIDLAARELADVSERLQAAANALRESI